MNPHHLLPHLSRNRDLRLEIEMKGCLLRKEGEVMENDDGCPAH